MRFQCVVCESKSLRDLERFSRLPRVTSDCKPWPAGGSLRVCEECGAIQKKPDSHWLDEIDRIYNAYQIYHLSAGAEQVIFSEAGAPAPRSRTLVDFVLSKLPKHEQGRLIDIGCGNGSALANFSAVLPNWRFDGSELSDKALPRLKAIPGFETLHIGSVKGKYDVVSMIHALEHMVSPADALAEAAAALEPHATLFVEVPDVETSPFDLLVADHLTHFSCETLRALAGRMALTVDFIANSVIPKEITFLGRQGSPASVSLNGRAGSAIADRTLQWLGDVLEAATLAASRATKFGIFGTSISGMWLYGALRERVDFFVDEDLSRVGQTYEGRPILSPAQAPDGSTVFISLSNTAADRVARRVAGSGASFVVPPAMAT